MQVGALRSLIEHNILPDTLVGCSVGALNAAHLAREVGLGQVEHIASIWREVSRRIVYPGGRMSVLWRVASGQDSLHDNRSFYQFLQDSGCTPALTFGAVGGARLFVTATVFRSGRMHVFGDDPNDRVLDALMASTALTPLHPPWEINGERYVDGGTVTPLPLRVALERGASEIWALHLLNEHGHDAEAEAHSAVASDKSAPPIHGVAGHISKAVDTMLRLQVEHDLHLVSGERRVKFHHVALVAPRRIDPAAFLFAEELMESGYEQTNAYLEHPAPVVAHGRVRHSPGWWQSMWGRWQAS
jgi:NTE family protein